MILVLLLFSFSNNLATSSELCFESSCNGNIISRFPFRIENRQPKSCGYRGFDLFCRATSDEPLLHLPPAGDFIVQYIDYKKQEIRINDPDKCLPRKILSLNLSGSPFLGKNSLDFAFFNCSSYYLPHWYVDPIYCLSSSSYMVYASSSPMLIDMFSSNCVMVQTVSVPSSSYYSSKPWDDLLLKWENPDCGSCESLGQRCEFKPNSSHDVQCTTISQGRPRVGTNVVAVVTGALAAVFCLLGLLCCFCIKVNSRSRTNNSSNGAHWTFFPQPKSTTGLDGPTIDSYPTFVLEEGLRLPEPNNNICPICLAQYRPKETVKSIPNCQHCFHQCCIDEWLRLKASCPVCRKSPNQSPPSNPP